MLRNIFLVLLLAVSFSCSKNEPAMVSPLIGAWTETEYFSDPGDGSGTWQPSVDHEVLLFNFPPKLINRSHLYSSPYDNFEIESDSTIRLFSSNDSTPGQIIYYKLSAENTRLELRPMCIEGCGYRYKRATIVVD